MMFLVYKLLGYRNGVKGICVIESVALLVYKYGNRKVVDKYTDLFMRKTYTVRVLIGSGNR